LSKLLGEARYLGFDLGVQLIHLLAELGALIRRNRANALLLGGENTGLTTEVLVAKSIQILGAGYRFEVFEECDSQLAELFIHNKKLRAISNQRSAFSNPRFRD
jgi:hypothetical protein